jgi:hypothetical protein
MRALSDLLGEEVTVVKSEQVEFTKLTTVGATERAQPSGTDSAVKHDAGQHVPSDLSTAIKISDRPAVAINFFNAYQKPRVLDQFNRDDIIIKREASARKSYLLLKCGDVKVLKDLETTVCCDPPLPPPHKHTHPPTHPLTHSPTHPLTHLFTVSLVHCVTSTTPRIALNPCCAIERCYKTCMLATVTHTNVFLPCIQCAR